MRANKRMLTARAIGVVLAAAFAVMVAGCAQTPTPPTPAMGGQAAAPMQTGL